MKPSLRMPDPPETEPEPACALAAESYHACPMHPDIRQLGAGHCPKCGIALELESLMHAYASDAELVELQHRFTVSALLGMPLLILMAGQGAHRFMDSASGIGIQAVLAGIVVGWGGRPFWVRAVGSMRRRRADMFGLVMLACLVSYGFSAFSLAFSLEGMAKAGLGFETSAAMMLFALLSQVLALKARTHSSNALRNLFAAIPQNTNPGELVHVASGDTLPVDGVVTHGSGMLDRSMLTGEHTSVHVAEGQEVLAGTLLGEGALDIRATRTGINTLLARIAAMAAGAQRTHAPMQTHCERLTVSMVPAVLAAALLAALAWRLAGPAPALAHAVHTATAVLIIACPFALALAASMPLLVASARGVRAGIAVRDAAALELLGRCDTLVLDKTGILTEGKPRLLAVMPGDGYTETNLMRMAASLERLSDHPLADAVVEGALERGIGFLEVHAFKVIPGKGVTGIMDGRSVGLGNAALMQSLGVSVLRTRAEPYRSQGQIVSFISVDGKPAGFLTVADPIKTATPDALKALKDGGLSVVMLTADSKSTAQAIGRKLGIDRVEAEIPPERKAEIIAELKAKGRRVAMAGDGTADAQALAQADVSIAMGTRSAAAMEQAGITLISGELEALVRARRLSRATIANARQNVAFALLYNGIGVLLAAGLLYPVCGILTSPAAAGFAMAMASAAVIANAQRLCRLRL